MHFAYVSMRVMLGLVVLGQSLAFADWLAIAVTVMANAVSVGSGSGA